VLLQPPDGFLRVQMVLQDMPGTYLSKDLFLALRDRLADPLLTEGTEVFRRVIKRQKAAFFHDRHYLSLGT
jgi:hypothetical protein